jgi:L-lactate dehydrogenase complex protein LldG
MTARDEVLGRIRQAIGGSKVLPIARDYRARGDHDPGAPELIDLLIDRLQDYKATVVRCADSDQGIAAAIAGVMDERSLDRLVTPGPGLQAWLPAARSIADLPPLPVDLLDRAEGVLTGSAVAIAETGTIALDASPRCGRRVITLVPDLHVCVVRADQIVQSVPEGIARLDPTAPLTFISGPSATSDIELDRVEGVHGPRQFIVVVAS